MTETAPEGLVSLQHRLQEVLTRMRTTHSGAPFATTLQALQQALVTANLPDQPTPWMRAAASQICAGHLVVLNTHELPERLEHLEPDPNTHAAG